VIGDGLVGAYDVAQAPHRLACDASGGFFLFQLGARETLASGRTP